MPYEIKKPGWRIESRQLGVAGFGGHNYLALIDPNGEVRDEIHGWGRKDGKIRFMPINEKSPPEDLEVRYKQPEIEGADVEVPLNGRDAEDIWKDFKITAQEHHKVHLYDWTGWGYDQESGKSFYNSNSFWRAVLEENGYDWVQLQPDSKRWTPGTGHVPPPPQGEPPEGVAGGGDGGDDGAGDASPVPYSDVEKQMDEGYAEFAAAGARAGSEEGADDPMDRSLDTWTDDDVKKVMRSNAYWSSGYPEHGSMHEKVRAWHVRKYDRPGGGGRSGGGGPVHVSAHMRAGAQVSDYSRARPAR